MSEEWKLKALNELLPLVKCLGGGLKTKSICRTLLEKGEKRIMEMISTPEILKGEFLQAKGGYNLTHIQHRCNHKCKCGVFGGLHTNLYFCDDNWRQREEDDWERGRDKD